LGLVPLTEENGEVFWTEAQSQENFQNVAMLVNPSAPETSRLLMAPLAPTAGGESHSGGIFWDSTNHSEYRLISEWIASGDPNAGAEPTVDVDFAFFRSCVQPIFVIQLTMQCPARNVTVDSLLCLHQKTATGPCSSLSKHLKNSSASSIPGDQIIAASCTNHFTPTQEEI
jgi:hypothetical protein